MKAQTVDVRESAGRILCCTIFRQSGRKLLAKGHILSEDDIRLLETEGLGQVWVTELEDGEVGEDEAVAQVATETGCGCLEIRLAAGGRANLFATEDCCVLVDEELLRQFMERQIWPDVPASASRRWTKEEEEAALGYGESGEPV